MTKLQKQNLKLERKIYRLTDRLNSCKIKLEAEKQKVKQLRQKSRQRVSSLKSKCEKSKEYYKNLYYKCQDSKIRYYILYRLSENYIDLVHKKIKTPWSSIWQAQEMDEVDKTYKLLKSKAKQGDYFYNIQNVNLPLYSLEYVLMLQKYSVYLLNPELIQKMNEEFNSFLNFIPKYLLVPNKNK